MDNLCKFHKFGYCKLKTQCEKQHVNKECAEGSHCRVMKTCPLRHPKMCKRIVMEGVCHYGEKCAYNHKKVLKSQDGNNDKVLEDVKALKADVTNIKNTIKLLMQNKEDETILKKLIEDIKNDIILLTASNKYIKEQLDLLEEDTDDESECGDAKNSEKEEPQKADIEFKCEECEFVGNTNISVKKHVNTEHAPLLMVDNDKETESVEECIEDLFQI